jgi:apolipoprotein N-acyltransferase
VLTGAVQPRIGLTPYVRFGNWPVLAMLWLVSPDRGGTAGARSDE